MRSVARSRPDIRAILPASVRAPLRIETFTTPPAPPAPPLPHRRTHTVATVGEWRSPPLPPATLAWWKIETTGPAFALPLPSPLSLSPLLPLSHSSSHSIAPTRPPAPDHWRAAYVPAPASPSAFLARVESPDRWLALGEPVEISALSHRTWQLAKHGAWLLAAGLLGWILLALALRRSGEARTLPPAPPPPEN